MALRTLLISTFMALAVISCGGGSTAGGIGGTGVGQGPVTGFGSIYVSGIKYETDSAGYTEEDTSANLNNLEVGMFVTVVHDGNGNATAVVYDDNAEGPITSGPDLTTNTFEVLGLTVQVDNLTFIEESGGAVWVLPTWRQATWSR